jgi:hypothetical protein
VEIAVNKALEVFGDNELIEVGYGDLYESVIFKNDRITVVVMPLRV